MRLRRKIWRRVRVNIPEGDILPRWMVCVRAMLYPLEFARHLIQMNQPRGYQWESSTWLIDGVRFSEEALHLLAASQGETYRVTRTGETVTLEQVNNEQWNTA